MAKMGDHFRRGKLQVAATVVGDLARIYCGTKAGKELSTAWYAINRADATLIAEVQKPAHRQPKSRGGELRR